MELQSVYLVVRTNQSGHGVEEWFSAIRPFLVRIGELIKVERKEVIEKLIRMIVESHACSVRFK